MRKYPRVEISKSLEKAGGSVLQFNEQDFNFGLESLGASQQAIESAVIRFDHYKRHDKGVTSEYDIKKNTITLYSAAIRIAENNPDIQPLGRKWSADWGFNGALAYQAYKLASYSNKLHQAVSPSEERQMLKVSRAKAMTIYMALVGSLGGELLTNSLYNSTRIEEIGGLIGAVVGSAVGLSSAAVLNRPIEHNRQQTRDLIDEQAISFSQSIQAISLFGDVIKFEFDPPSQRQLSTIEQAYANQPNLRLISDH